MTSTARGPGSRIAALLLVGPTGSGKSPLGDVLEQLTGWAHLDFGALLREIAAGEAAHGLSSAERDVVRELLRANELFPDEAFALVGRILEDFLASRGRPAGLVLNGLPRHVSQARSLSHYVDVVRVVFLNAPAEVVQERVARRRLGESADHAGRADDALPDVRRKLALFEERTLPLVEHYALRGVPVTELQVASAHSDERSLAREILDAGWPP